MRYAKSGEEKRYSLQNLAPINSVIEAISVPMVTKTKEVENSF